MLYSDPDLQKNNVNRKPLERNFTCIRWAVSIGPASRKDNSCATPRAVFSNLKLGLGISDKNIIRRKTEETEQLVISDGILAVPRNRKLSEFRSESFSGRENNSEFRFVEPK
jgi:hypothetical protein